MTIPIALLPRDVAATASTTCSAVSLDVRITYATTLDQRTPLQRRIDAQSAPPDDARRVLLGDLEFYYPDGRHLGGLSLYANFAKIASRPLARGDTGATPSWLTFPDLPMTDRDVITYPMPLSIRIDRDASVIQLVLGTGAPTQTHALADTIWLGLDDNDAPCELTIAGVTWSAD